MEPTKRATHAHLLVCVGCCCGRVDRGKPEVPVDWLKAEWKRRTLLKHVQLSISGCLGPCDLVNVVAVANADGIDYFGRLTTRAHFEALVDWASACAAAGRALPVPDLIAAGRIDRFRDPAISAPRDHGALAAAL